jgi:general secretion pathway protein H
VRDEAGFTLIEMVCVLAIIGLMASLALPAFPRGTSRARLEGYAMETASLLIADRDAAIRRHAVIRSAVNPEKGGILSGAYPRGVQFPADVAFDALLAKTCAGHATSATIDFFPNGTSCGGTIALTRGDSGYQIRVNWLTAAVEIVPQTAGGR